MDITNAFVNNLFKEKEINPPKMDEEIKLLAMKIEGELKINEDIVFIKEVKNNKITWFSLPFSYLMALRHLKRAKEYKYLGVIGLVQLPNNKLIITKQRPISFEAGGVTLKRKGYYGLSYAGFVKRTSEGAIIRNNIYYEMEEELGLLKEDVELKKLLLIEKEDSYKLLVLLSTQLDEDKVLRLSKTAIDAWEREEILFLDKQDSLKLLEEYYKNIVSSLLA